ncbi:hypothetical protein [Arthrobacter dokdonensis]|uniref:hypothetical protein n=1 Tax=Arthrobacter dokdonellae TaxID=2211210 RepID=UPI000DE594D1|nr:hypothetical protein [Arthrobacter dokdonellae]
MAPSPAHGPAETAPKRPSVGWGVVITLAGWVILAFPAFIALFLTAASFSGCFLDCTTPKPQPAAGMAGVIILAAMVACPPMLGLAVVRGGRKWWIALGTFVLVVFGFIVYASM